MVKTKNLKVYRDLSDCYQHFERKNRLALDLETTGLSPYRDNIAVVAIGDQDGNVLVQHIAGSGWPSALTRLLTRRDVEWVTHNGYGFDWLFLKEAGIPFGEVVYDTLIGEQVLIYQDRHDIRRDLATTMKRRLGRVLKKEMDHSGWSNPTLNAEQVDYASHDVAYLLDVADVQIAEAAKKRMTAALEFEQIVAGVVTKVMWNGMACPRESLDAIKRQMEIDAIESTKRVQYALPDINLNSPIKLKNRINDLYDLGLENVRKETLMEFEEGFPLFKDIRISKASIKRTGFYDDEWAETFIIDNILHGHIWTLGANTSRMTSSNPNLQQIPRDMRNIVGNQPGFKVISADYAQIEVRLMAFYANDKRLAEACATDLHSQMARQMFKTPFGPVQPHLRSPLGKYGTFSWQFKGSYKAVIRSALKGGTRMSRTDAERMLLNLNRSFPATAKAHKNAADLVKGGLLVVDLPLGHKRAFRPGFMSPQKYLNTLDQGSAAVGLKEGLVEMDCRGLTDYVGGLVHDEIVSTGVPESEAEEYEREMVDAMKVGMVRMMDGVRKQYPRSDFIEVPVEVESKVGLTWK